MMYKNWSGVWSMVAESFSKVFGFVSPTPSIEDTYFEDVKSAIASVIQNQEVAHVVLDDSYSNIYSIYVPAIYQQTVVERIRKWGVQKNLTISLGTTMKTLIYNKVTLIISRT